MKTPLIVATSRVIKLVANITKVLSYPFHWSTGYCPTSTSRFPSKQLRS